MAKAKKGKGRAKQKKAANPKVKLTGKEVTVRVSRRTQHELESQPVPLSPSNRAPPAEAAQKSVPSHRPSARPPAAARDRDSSSSSTGSHNNSPAKGSRSSGRPPQRSPPRRAPPPPVPSKRGGKPTRRPPRYRPPPKVLSEIRRLQTSTNRLIPAQAFGRLVREITEEITHTQLRYQGLAIRALHEAAEAYLIGLFEDSYICSLHAKRVTLLKKDVLLAYRIRGDFIRVGM